MSDAFGQVTSSIPGSRKVASSELDTLTKYLAPIFSDGITFKLEVLECTDIPSIRDPGAAPNTYVALRWFDPEEPVAESHIALSTANPRYNWEKSIQLPRNEATLAELCGKPLHIFIKEALGDKLLQAMGEGGAIVDSTKRSHSKGQQPEEPSIGLVTAVAQIDLFPFVTQGVTTIEQWCPLKLSPLGRRAAVHADMTQAAALAVQSTHPAALAVTHGHEGATKQTVNSSSQQQLHVPGAGSSTTAAEPRRISMTMQSTGQGAKAMLKGIPAGSSLVPASARGSSGAGSHSSASNTAPGSVLTTDAAPQPPHSAALDPATVCVVKSNPRMRVRVSLSSPLVTEEERKSLTILEFSVNDLQSLPSKWLAPDGPLDAIPASGYNSGDVWLGAASTKYEKETNQLVAQAGPALTLAQNYFKLVEKQGGRRPSGFRLSSEDVAAALASLPNSIRARVGHTGSDEDSTGSEAPNVPSGPSTGRSLMSARRNPGASALNAQVSNATGTAGTVLPSASLPIAGGPGAQAGGVRRGMNTKNGPVSSQQQQQNAQQAPAHGQQQINATIDEMSSGLQAQNVFSVAYALPLTASASLPVKHCATYLVTPPLPALPATPDFASMPANSAVVPPTSSIESTDPNASPTAASTAAPASTRRRASKAVNSNPTSDDGGHTSQAQANDLDAKKFAWLQQQQQYAQQQQAAQRYVAWNSTRRAFLTPLTLQALLSSSEGENPVSNAIDFQIWSSPMPIALVKSLCNSIQTASMSLVSNTPSTSTTAPTPTNSSAAMPVQSPTAGGHFTFDATSTAAGTGTGVNMCSSLTAPSISSPLSPTAILAASAVGILNETVDGIPAGIARSHSRNAAFAFPLPLSVPTVTVTPAMPTSSSTDQALTASTNPPTSVPHLVSLSGTSTECALAIPFFSVSPPDLSQTVWPPKAGLPTPHYLPVLSNASVLSDPATVGIQKTTALNQFPEQARVRGVAKLHLANLLLTSLEDQDKDGSPDVFTLSLPVELDKKCIAHVLLAQVTEAEIEALQKRCTEINEFAQREVERLNAAAGSQPTQYSSNSAPSERSALASGASVGAAATSGAVAGPASKRRLGPGLMTSPSTSTLLGADRHTLAGHPQSSAQQAANSSAAATTPLVESEDPNDPGFILLHPLKQLAIVRKAARETTLRKCLSVLGIGDPSTVAKCDEVLSKHSEPQAQFQALVELLSTHSEWDVFIQSGSKLSVSVKVVKSSTGYQSGLRTAEAVLRSRNVPVLPRPGTRASIKYGLTSIPTIMPEEHIDREVRLALSALAEMFDSPPEEASSAMLRAHKKLEARGTSLNNGAVEAIFEQTMIQAWNATGNFQLFKERVRPALARLYRRIVSEMEHGRLARGNALGTKKNETAAEAPSIAAVAALFSSLMKGIAEKINQIRAASAVSQTTLAKDLVAMATQIPSASLSNSYSMVQYVEPLTPAELLAQAQDREKYEKDWEVACQLYWRLVAVPATYAPPSHTSREINTATTKQGIDFALYSAEASADHWLHLGEFYLRATTDGALESDTDAPDHDFEDVTHLIQNHSLNATVSYPIPLLPVRRARANRRIGLAYAEYALKQALSLDPEHILATALLAGVYLCTGQTRAANDLLAYALDDPDRGQVLQHDLSSVPPSSLRPSVLMALRYLTLKGVGRTLEAKDALAAALVLFTRENSALYRLPVPFTGALPLPGPKPTGSVPDTYDCLSMVTPSVYAALFTQTADYFICNRLLPLAHVALSHALAASGCSLLSIPPAPPTRERADPARTENRVIGKDFLVQLGRFYVTLANVSRAERFESLQLAQRCFAAAATSVGMLHEIVDKRQAGDAVKWALDVLPLADPLPSPVPVLVKLKLILPVVAELGRAIFAANDYHAAEYVLTTYHRWAALYLSPVPLNEEALYTLAMARTTIAEGYGDTPESKSVCENALSALEDFAKRHVHVSNVHRAVAKMYVGLNQFLKAQQALARAYSLAPLHPDLWLIVARYYQRIATAPDSALNDLKTSKEFGLPPDITLASPEQICAVDTLRSRASVNYSAALMRHSQLSARSVKL